MRPAVAAIAWGGFGVVAVALSVTASLWSDEGDTWTTSSNSTSYFLDALADWDNHSPLYFSLIRAVSVVGDQELVLRFPSVVAGLVTIALIGRLSEVLAGPRARYVGVLLGATNALLLYHATEARNYALTMALGAASTLALVRATTAPTRANWAWYAVATFFVVLSHSLAITLVVGHAAWMAIEWRRNRLRPPAAAWLAWGLVAVTCAVMAALLLLANDSETEFETLSYRSPVTLVRDVFGNRSWLPLLPASVAFALGARTALAAPDLGADASPVAPEPSARLLVLLTATVPIALLLVGSLVAPSSVAGARYASPVVPAAVALAAAGVVSLARRPRQVLLLLTVATGLAAQVRTASDRDFEEFESAMAHVRSAEDEPSAVVYFDPYIGWVGAYYLRDVAADRRPVPLVPGRTFPAPLRLDEPIIPIAEVAEAAAAGPDLLWLVVRPREAEGRADDYRELRSTLAEAGYDAAGTRRFAGVELVELRRDG